MLFLFIFAFIFDVLIGLFIDSIRDFYAINPSITMLLISVLLIVIEAFIAMISAKLNWILKI